MNRRTFLHTFGLATAGLLAINEQVYLPFVRTAPTGSSS